MSEITNKDETTAELRLAYHEALVHTMMGLESANSDLIARRGHADSNESRTIDVHLAYNSADWSKAHAALILYQTENVKFKPPSTEILTEMLSIVQYLDGVIAAETQARAIIEKTAELVAIFRNTQA